MEKQNKNSKISLEIIRFLITGVICAIADFLVSFVVKELLYALEIEWLKIAIYTFAGFVVGVILNYLLSTFFVFKNVKDEKESKTAKFIVLFVLLSAVGWFLSYLTMQLSTMACQAWWGINISDSLISAGMSIEILASLEFWLYVIAFILKTFVGMVWNYLTRKFILYKAPKEEKIVNNEEGEGNETHE